MHIAPFDNHNQPIVDIDDNTVPLNYFNIVKLKKGQSFEYQVPGYETCIAPATGSVDIEVEGVSFKSLGNRGVDVWDGEPEGAYIPVGAKVTITCVSDATETFIAGARHDETYNFRFRPNHGSGVQMLQREDGKPGDAYHIVDGSTICLDNGYHPCCVLPGYEMYYFTILGGLSQRSLVQYFQPSHAYQIETIPGIKDMIAKFK